MAATEDTREALIEAAMELLLEDGPGAIGLRAVARRAGVSHGAPYRHFDNHDDLLCAVAERGCRQLWERCVHAQSGAGSDARIRFQAIGVTYMCFAWEHPGRFAVMFSEVASASDAVRSAQGSIFALASSAISAAQRQGHFAPGDPQELALIAWSGVHGYAQLRTGGLVSWLGLDHDDPVELARRVTTKLFMGLRA